MARITYTTEVDGITVAKGVFDSSTAQQFEGDVSDLDEHTRLEYLYLTDDGDWVVNTLDGSGFNSQYHWMDPADAKRWLLKNHHPEAARRYFSPQGGRPTKGTRVDTHISLHSLMRVEKFAAQGELSRPEALRQLINLALDHLDVHNQFDKRALRRQYAAGEPDVTVVP